MLIDWSYPDRLLLELADLPRDPLPEAVRGHEAALRTVARWASDYLTNPHPELGRKGPVCPFAQASMDRGTFYLGLYRGVPADRNEVAATLTYYRDWFLEMGPSRGTAAQFRTMLVLFPDVPADDLTRFIDESQEALKIDYVSHGLMIGEFHDAPPDKAGLWNDDFRPLHSPVPLLAIRHMVPTDLPFLSHDRDYMAAYLRRFSYDDIPARLRAMVDEAATTLGFEVPSPTPSPRPMAHTAELT
ncbi:MULTISPECIES: DUF6875 domain-containing protein [unclassified Streptomyces]|uniref:DUF6875 domain-containing protein n=1 Tax=unclassified Streptomyces TaxID=2593676 RepID=UPI002DD87B3D|nr:hypothetical protein [Streptomyces sp. NBC_01750]WSB01058.1 hypothetical protein OIE54_18110 [Streptomyces sp. NBC_01794]WSD34589.1 hypothetical protein OG966_23500 [Streptomyces sp. NBC_01750]